MKTTEQAKNDYVDNLNHIEKLTKQDIIEQNFNAFDTGKFFAEEWISVESELPPLVTGRAEESNMILLRNAKDGGITLGWRMYYGYETQLGLIKEDTITHWRPITRK